MIAYTFILVLGIVGAAWGQVTQGPQPEHAFKIDPALNVQLRSGVTPKLLVSFAGGTKATLERVSSLRFDEPGQRSTAFYEALVQNADESQNALELMLSTRSEGGNPVQFRKFWITNSMVVKGADEKTIREIAELETVTKIEAEPVMELFDVEPPFDPDAPTRYDVPRPEDGTVQWNIERVEAPAAWEELGHRGEGAVVGIIDTGVLHTHETLRDNFLGDYGWFDPLGGKLEPHEENWHGTSVTALAVGSRGVGVAPGAKWAHCKGCGFNCETETLLACGEFFLCPTLANGTNRDCSKAPRVIANSWGGAFDDATNDMVAAWTAVGIIPVFAIGNSEGCETAAFPARHADVIAVGNVNMDNSISGTDSSKGPVFQPDGSWIIKPELVAPGEKVVTAKNNLFGSVVKYGYENGTSFSCPHVVGVIALLLSRQQDLTFAQVKELLYKNANWEIMHVPLKPLSHFGSLCRSVDSEGVIRWPNNHYGHGMVSAHRAVQAQSLVMKGNVK